jgi:hypothetical protein
MNEHRQAIREALVLLNSMVACGEGHTASSRSVLAQAFKSLDVGFSTPSAEQKPLTAPVSTSLPPDYTRDQQLNAVIRLALMRESLRNVVFDSKAYLALLPEGALKAEHAEMNKKLLGIQADFTKRLDNDKSLLSPGIVAGYPPR